LASSIFPDKISFTWLNLKLASGENSIIHVYSSWLDVDATVFVIIHNTKFVICLYC